MGWSQWASPQVNLFQMNFGLHPKVKHFVTALVFYVSRFGSHVVPLWQCQVLWTQHVPPSVYIKVYNDNAKWLQQYHRSATIEVLKVMYISGQYTYLWLHYNILCRLHYVGITTDNHNQSHNMAITLRWWTHTATPVTCCCIICSRCQVL